MIKTITIFFNSQKWRLARKVLRLMLVITLAKLLVHYSSLEFLPLSSLFTAIISANIFLISFLITGVLSDYKESEKLPGDLAASLEAITDEMSIIYSNKKTKIVKGGINHINSLVVKLIDWFHKKEKTDSIINEISGLNKYFLAFEPLTQANFIMRMKQEQSNIRKIVTRIHTIRETTFNEAGYAIAEIISTVLVFGLIFLKLDPFYENIFFVIFVSFILIYMVMLIRDLDNPFGYYEKNNLSQEVSLKPLHDLKKRLNQSYTRSPRS